MTIKDTLSTGAAIALGSVNATATERTPADSEVWDPEPVHVATPLNAAPSDAVVLFDGSGLSEWESVQGGECPWSVADGVLTVVPGSKDIRTKRSFGDAQLHIEWRTPIYKEPKIGQGPGNSGVFFQERYEVQVLDSYENRTYANGQAAAIYKQAIPLVNASRAPGEWQTYDIIWTAPRFSQGGGLLSPARITVLHNGILVQNNTILAGKTEYLVPPSYSPHGPGPLMLQDHGEEVSFRNIWIREL
ncbi:large, multifunctional secreted protein [Cephaloticoccus primus]|uniref:Large, multifunctional secreted protein n=1 Tax=Cephaloticoccus primus TaxID=1548207 RepID=A0A139SSH8_9BACT|nr:DUF1080 domain-containing protein [Cephaloticoccus primus]KXU37535.1 large, multifunctional secreted protein [Cephaloticoccus primus]